MQKILVKNYKKFLVFSCFLFCLVSLLITVNISFAEDNLWEQQGSMMVGADKVSEAFGESDSPTDPRTVIINVAKIFLSFLALIFTLIVMWAGYTWMTSEGNQEKTTVAKKWLTRGVIGIAVILSALMIVSFIFRQSSGFLT